jgi:hypothetical protein
MVEHSPLYPKVNGLSPAAAVGRGREFIMAELIMSIKCFVRVYDNN